MVIFVHNNSFFMKSCSLRGDAFFSFPLSDNQIDIWRFMSSVVLL